ncbi:olfactory receptor 52D1-like [Hoplias malabaricus]|uniref:olfactory receptor 52D1-like n=1 Tax=Hoplias malabaricus TaxID=27720 RepID=UPI003462F557
MENLTFNSPVLQLEGLVVSELYIYPAFLSLLFAYVLIVISNTAIILLITMERRLHEPMYLLFCNLPFNDVFGNSVVVPRLMVDMLKPASERYISFRDCVTQAFGYHMFSVASNCILMVMAFDRYVAICNPLHYTTIMTTKMVAKLTVSAWAVTLLLVCILLSLTLRLNHCGTFITNPFCDNVSLYKLSCEGSFISNVYGLVYTAVVAGCSLTTIGITYSKIAIVCLSSKNKSLNSKALKTCSTHLTVFMIMWSCGCSMFILHRFSGVAEYRKAAALIFHIIPGILNPLIYALQCTEIRHVILKLLNIKKQVP